VRTARATARSAAITASDTSEPNGQESVTSRPRPHSPNVLSISPSASASRILARSRVTESRPGKSLGRSTLSTASIARCTSNRASSLTAGLPGRVRTTVSVLRGSVGGSSPLPGSTSDNSIYVKYDPEELSPPRRGCPRPLISRIQRRFPTPTTILTTLAEASCCIRRSETKVPQGGSMRGRRSRQQVAVRLVILRAGCRSLPVMGAE